MAVTVSKDAIVDLLIETITSADSKEKPAPAVVSEPKASKPPVEASETMQPEGIFELPPVEDTEYEPHNVAALSRAAFALAKLVPPKQVEKFFRKLKDLSQDAVAWQKEEDMNMNVYEQRLRAKIRHLIKEANGDSFAGMLDDFEEDEPRLKPGEEGPYSEEEAGQKSASDALRAKSNAAVPKSWSDIKLKKKRKQFDWLDDDTYEEWEKPGYKAEPIGDPGDYGNPLTLDAIAGEVEGLNTPSAVRQFLEDPRKLNLMDKVMFLVNMPEKQREKIMISTAADFITKLEDGKLKTPLNHNDPVIRTVIDHYVGELEAEGIIEPEDATTLKNRTEYVAELDSFKSYAGSYFDNNFDELMKYEPFRLALKKVWSKMMRSNPELQDYVAKRKEKDLERVRKKKAARKSK